MGRNAKKGTYNGEPTYCTVNAIGLIVIRKGFVTLMTQLKIVMILALSLKIGTNGLNAANAAFHFTTPQMLNI